MINNKINSVVFDNLWPGNISPSGCPTPKKRLQQCFAILTRAIVETSFDCLYATSLHSKTLHGSQDFYS